MKDILFLYNYAMALFYYEWEFFLPEKDSKSWNFRGNKRQMELWNNKSLSVYLTGKGI